MRTGKGNEQMKKITTWILALLLLVALVGGGTLYRKFAAGQSGSQLQAGSKKAESSTESSAESRAAEGQDSITAKAGTEQTTAAAEESSEALSEAPDFTVQDADGTAHKLSEYKGKPVVLNFWASWCGPCRMEMPEFDEVYKARGEEVHFLMVNMTDGNRETVKTASEFVSKQGYSLPILYDTAQDAAQTYGVFSIPCTYFIDADGMLTAQARGAINKETLERGIDMIVKQ